MIDSCCIEHNKIFKYYCYKCNINICAICKEKHKDHNLINLSDIEIKEDEIINLKQSLEKEINELKKIIDYFLILIEKLKEEFKYFYELKQKEIEIKQKIINDYEIIKYNYNSIQNVYNIVNDNKNNFNDLSSYYEKNNKGNYLEEINSIYNLMKNNIEPFYKRKDIITTNMNKNEISSMIKLNNNHISISSFEGFVEIYNIDNKNINHALILRKKIFERGEGINDMILLKNGDLALSGKKVKIMNFNLENIICKIVNEISVGNGFVDLIHDIGNNYLIIYDSNHELKLYENYQFIYMFNTSFDNIDNIFKINDISFITSSLKANTIYLFKINYEKNIPEISSFSLSEQMHIKKGKSSFIKIKNDFYIFIYEKEKVKNGLLEKLEESKNEEEIRIENGLCLIEMQINKNNFNILQKIESLDDKKNYINLFKNLNDEILIVDDCGLFETWGFDNINKKMFVKNRIYYICEDRIILNALVFEETKDIIIQTNQKILVVSK